MLGRDLEGHLMPKALIALLSLLALAGSVAGARAQQIDVEAISKRPGFQVTKKVVHGEEITEIRYATVVIEITRDGAIGSDSGKVAIFCAWDIYVGLMLGADYCYPDSHWELKEDLVDAVERLEGFIVANSLTPITREQLEAAVQRRRKEFVDGISRMPAHGPRCPSTSWIDELQRDGRAKRRADVTEMLAVPRPPVLNPCL